MNLRVTMLVLVAALAAGCPKGSDTGDSGYDGQSRVRGPDMGWRPAPAVVVGAEARK